MKVFEVIFIVEDRSQPITSVNGVTKHPMMNEVFYFGAEDFKQVVEQISTDPYYIEKEFSQIREIIPMIQIIQKSAF